MYMARIDNTFADSKSPNLIYQYKAYYHLISQLMSKKTASSQKEL